MADGRRFLSASRLIARMFGTQIRERLRPSRYQNTLPLTPLWGSSFRRPLGWTLSNPFSFAKEVEKIEGEREAQQACCCCVCEKMCTAVAAAQLGVYAMYVCAIQQQFIDA